MKPFDQPNQFAHVLERTMSVVEAENVALRERRPYHIGEWHARKAMALYELEHLGNLSSARRENLRPGLERLRELLGENHSLLRLNIAALGEVMDVIHSHQLGIESDGTYSATSVSRTNR